MLRWMAPFLSFTAEEAWAIFAKGDQSIFVETYSSFPQPDAGLLAKWARIRAIREAANKEIEKLREAGQVGASLQATLRITAAPEDAALLRSLGDDLRFVTITSAATLVDGDALAIEVTPSTDAKCARCWHYVEDVNANAEWPGLCGRCVGNLTGHDEVRRTA